MAFPNLKAVLDVVNNPTRITATELSTVSGTVLDTLADQVGLKRGLTPGNVLGAETDEELRMRITQQVTRRAPKPYISAMQSVLEGALGDLDHNLRQVAPAGTRLHMTVKVTVVGTGEEIVAEIKDDEMTSKSSKPPPDARMCMTCAGKGTVLGQGPATALGRGIELCPDCGGIGNVRPRATGEVCPSCKGRGEVVKEATHAHHMPRMVGCIACRGTGQKLEVGCDSCGHPAEYHRPDANISIATRYQCTHVACSCRHYVATGTPTTPPMPDRKGESEW